MSTPVIDRVSAVQAGGCRASGLPALRAQFNSADSEKSYDEWAKHPVTGLVRKALYDMAINGPASMQSSESYAVQYGMTLGLGLAAQLLDDPSVVFPDIFSGKPATVQVEASDMVETFHTDPYEALDKME